MPALDALKSAGYEIVGVLTQPDRPAGRGRRLQCSPVKHRAQALALPLDQPAALHSEASWRTLASWQPDLLVVVAYGIILRPQVLALPRLGCVNIHASILPRWRGAAPIQRAILAGDTSTGVTIMQMDAGLDTGPVWLMRSVPIAPRATSDTLHEELAALGAAALLDTLPRIASGAESPEPQSELGVTYAPKIGKAEAEIDWRSSATEIDRKVRAFHPWPVAVTRAGAEVLRIHRARPLARQAAPPGVVLGFSPYDDALLVACGDGTLAIEEMQRPGRKPVHAREFAHGVQLEGRVLG